MATRRVRDLGVQSVSDFFKSASRNMFITLTLVRLAAIFMLYLLVSYILAILVPGVKDIQNLRYLLNYLVLIFIVFALVLLTLITFALGALVPNDQVTTDYFLAIRAFIMNEMFGGIPELPGIDNNTFLSTSNDSFGPLAYLLNKPQKAVYNPYLINGIILLGIALVIITGIGFIRRSDVKLAGMSLIFSQLVIGLAYLKGLTLDLSLNSSTISTMLGSTLFQLALISYLYFEFSLQTGYLYDLTNPTLTRQKRVAKQLETLSKFRLGTTKLGTEDERESSEAATQMKSEIEDEEEEERTSTSLSAGSGSTSARKYNADALLFLLDSAQDSLFAKPGGEDERLTNKLQKYHDGLLQHDSKLDDKLGGSAEKTFNPFTVIITVIFSLVIRVAAIVFLSWLILKPQVLLNFINLPASITNSLEINEPEGILMVLIPVVFLIIGISYLFAKLQEWIVKAEELIIEEADISKILAAGKSVIRRTGKKGEIKREELEQQFLSDTEGQNKKE